MGFTKVILAVQQIVLLESTAKVARRQKRVLALLVTMDHLVPSTQAMEGCGIRVAGNVFTDIPTKVMLAILVKPRCRTSPVVLVRIFSVVREILQRARSVRVHICWHSTPLMV